MIKIEIVQFYKENKSLQGLSIETIKFFNTRKIKFDNNEIAYHQNLPGSSINIIESIFVKDLLKESQKFSISCF